MIKLKTISYLLNICFLVVLSISIGWILRLGSSRKELTNEINTQKETIETYESFIGNSVKANTSIGAKFPVCEMKDIKNNTISTDFSRKRGGIVLLFEPKICQACLLTQLKTLQFIRRALLDPEELPIYAITSYSEETLMRYVRSVSPDYHFICDRDSVIFRGDLGKTTPIVYLMNSNNTIIACHIPTIGKGEHSILFYNQIIGRQLFRQLSVSLDTGKVALHLGMNTYFDVIKGNIDNDIVSSLLY